MYIWHKYKLFSIHDINDGTRNLCYEFHASALAKKLTWDCFSDVIDEEREPRDFIKSISIGLEIRKHLGEITTMYIVIW